MKPIFGVLVVGGLLAIASQSWADCLWNSITEQCEGGCSAGETCGMLVPPTLCGCSTTVPALNWGGMLFVNLFLATAGVWSIRRARRGMS